jgi:hypothetical protein
LGRARAVERRSARRSRASSRLRICERESWETAVTRGPRRASRRTRWESLREVEASTSKLASTREAVTLACCPPGPEERLVRWAISDRGIERPGVICRRGGEGSGVTALTAKCLLVRAIGRWLALALTILPVASGFGRAEIEGVRFCV